MAGVAVSGGEGTDGVEVAVAIVAGADAGALASAKMSLHWPSYHAFTSTPMPVVSHVKINKSSRLFFAATFA